MSALKTPIDYKSLEEELHAALATDELYQLQNDAKIRAIEQNVPTYEHFRQMVNGAHLKPLDHDDTKPKIGVLWNPMIDNTRFHHSVMSTKSEKLKYDTEKTEDVRKKPAERYEDLSEFWRTTADCSEKFAYLWSLRDILRTHIFRIEIPPFFFGDFMDVCLQHLSNANDVIPIIELLSTLSTCNRFDLTISFMSKDEHLACKQLFQQLQLQGKVQDKSLERAIVSLIAKYKVHFT